MARTIEDLARQQSENALRAPEQLDQVMTITRRRTWIILLVTGAVIAVALTWGFLGEINSYVIGRGMFLPKGSPVMLEANGPLRVREILVKEGDVVREGQLVALLSDPELEQEVEDARVNLEEVTEVDRLMTQSEDRKVAVAREQFEKTETSLNRAISDAEMLQTLQEAQLKAEKELLDEGLIPKQQWIQTQQALAQFIQQRLSTEAQLQDNALQFMSTTEQIQQARDTRQLQILSANASFDQANTKVRAETVIVAPIAGEVMSVLVDKYEMVNPGTNLVELLPSEGKKLRIIAYVSAQHGKQIKKGMRAVVSPSYVHAERYGYIVAEVTNISELVEAEARLLKTYQSDVFVEEIIQAIPSPLRIEVTPLLDPSTPSGYDWTSEVGMPGKVTVGTIASIRVAVERDRPIELLIPWLKKEVGIDG